LFFDKDGDVFHGDKAGAAYNVLVDLWEEEFVFVWF
jgi:hypothetical protein